MTTLLEDPPVASPAPAEQPRATPWWRVLPWVPPAVAAVATLLWLGTPAASIAIYAAYFAVAVVLPGTLVLRALHGSRGNWPEDLGLGAAAGLVVQLIGWALAAATGARVLLPIWLALVVLLFVAVPGLRRHWRISEPRPLPLAWSWGMSVVLLLVVLAGVTNLRTVALPPTTFEIYQDIYYHLALVHEMARTIPFHVPQVDGETLRYHYLSDADMASASALTGISPATVYLRLWFLPIVGTAAFVFAALARSVSGRWWTGPVAAAAVVAGRAMLANGAVMPFGSGLPVMLISPSQTYVMPLIALFTLIAVEALRGRPLRWMWAALPVLAVACAGSKSSGLPPLVAGLVLAGLALLVKQRRVPWTAAGLLAVAGLGMLAGLKLFAGGGAGTLQLQFLSTLRRMPPYEGTIGSGDGIELGGLVPDGVAHAGTAGRLFVAFVVLWWVLSQAPRLLGLVLPSRDFDVAWWLLGGIVLAGVGAVWVFWHPSSSQIYFFAGTAPFGALLTVCALAGRADRFRAAAVGAALAAAAWVVVVPQIHGPVRNNFVGWGKALAEPFLYTAAAVIVAVAIAVAIWRKRALVALPTALVAAVVAAGLAGGVSYQLASLNDPRPKPRPAVAVTAAEMRAALWLGEHSGEDDLVATNVHCVPLNAEKCNARAFWVAGLSGRRTLIESWGYSDSAVAAHGKNGLAYYFQPAPDPAVYELNQRVFAEGDAAGVRRLRDEHGVKWLFADSRAGTVSPALARVADIRFQDGPATVYEIRAGA
ncbi:hypothetical protein ACQP2X_16240 [Actinoplanes sp. CA-131856]